MRHLRLTILLWLALIVVAASPARAEPRFALVIGNADYGPLGELTNARADATLMAEALERVGFAVDLRIDADPAAMQAAVVAFGRRLAAAGPEAAGLFYFAGHGIQESGRNFLIPVAAPVSGTGDLAATAITADWVLRVMNEAGNAVNVLVLDACRDNPFREADLPAPAVAEAGSERGDGRTLRSLSGGLARLNAPSGSFIGYATGPGMVAYDGDGRNSPYTAALARALTLPGQPIEQVFKRVRIDVIEATGGAQIPWDSSSLTRDFVFASAAPGLPSTAAALAAPPAAGADGVTVAISLGGTSNPYGNCETLRAGEVTLSLAPGAGWVPVVVHGHSRRREIPVMARARRAGDALVVALRPYPEEVGPDEAFEVTLDDPKPGASARQVLGMRFRNTYRQCGTIVGYVSIGR